MITLWVMPDGLNPNHDPNNPQLADIRKTVVLAQSADRVILQTANGKFLRKDPTNPDGQWEGAPMDFSSPNDTRVIFDPVFGMKTLECKGQAPSDTDMAKFAAMLIAVRGY